VDVNQYSSKGKLFEEDWFKDSAEGFELMGVRCDACGKFFFPKKLVCPNCFDGELKEVPLSKIGTLHCFALSIMGPPEIEKPYVMGFVDLPEGIKLFSILTDCEPWDEVLKIGMEMEMVMGKLKQDQDGNDILSYKFRPVKKETK
jgi:uncharacterized OB-fold protein